jgi:hypothetical protein
MFERSLRVAKGCLQGFLAVSARAAKALCDSFGSKNDAETRGQTLLREWLSPEQLVQYHANGYFDVVGCASGKRYRVHYGTSMNVHEIDNDGSARVGWCFVPDICLVAGDVMLAQKIALETNELGALAVAKEFSPARREAPVIQSASEPVVEIDAYDMTHEIRAPTSPRSW